MDYNEIWRIVQKEKQTNDIQILPKTIYQEIINYIHSTENTNKSEDKENTKRNLLKLLNELYEKRRQKLLIYIAYKKPLPQPSIKIEEDFYNEINGIMSKNKVFDILNNDLKNKTTLKVLKELNTEIRLPSGKLVGPFIKDSIIELEEKEDIQYLLNNSICIQP